MNAPNLIECPLCCGNPCGCMLCMNAGKVTPLRKQWYDWGTEMSGYRARRRLYPVEASKQLGVTLEEYKRMEVGLLEPMITRARYLWAQWMLLAGNAREAKEYAMGNEIRYWDYPARADYLRGHTDFLVREVGTFGSRSDAYQFRKIINYYLDCGRAREI